MEVALKVNAVRGIFSPTDFFIAENEDITINLESSYKGKTALVFNGAVFIFNEQNQVSIPHQYLAVGQQTVLVELVNELGNTLRQWACEGLVAREYDRHERVFGELDFYKKYVTELEERVSDLENHSAIISQELVKTQTALGDLQQDFAGLKEELNI